MLRFLVMKNLQYIALGLILSHDCYAETTSILVNLGLANSNGDGQYIATTAKDFQLADPKIEKMALVNQVSAPRHVLWYVLDLFTAQDNKGGKHEIDVKGLNLR